MKLNASARAAVNKLAASCAQSYAWANAAAIDWQKIIMAILSAIISGCLPMGRDEAVAMPRKWVVRCSKGVTGCCPGAVRRKLSRDEGITDKVEQDRVFYTAVLAGNHDKKSVAAAVEGSAEE